MLGMSRVRAGRWEGLWEGDARPDFSVTHLGKTLPDVEIEQERPGRWRIAAPIPAELLNDGVQTFVLKNGAETCGSFAIVSGAPLEEDLRAEISLMRAELDLLKQAFRRHCVETGND